MLVSVAIITYNSSKTVLETLDSTLKQSYGSKNIELIISDDASSDNTVEIVNKWIASHKDFFHKVIFIQNSINRGVSANINTAWKAVSSEWVKSIAGDDLLHERCIELNVKYIKDNSDCKILFSKMQMFGRFNHIIPTPYNARLFDKNSKQQYNWLRTFSFNMAPSAFISHKLLEEVGYANETYRMIEDLPLWLKITKAGHKLYYTDVVTVYYRIDDSISVPKDKYINELFLKDLLNIYIDNRTSFIKEPFINMVIVEKIINYKLTLFISKMTNNNPSACTMLASNTIRLLQPLHAVCRVSTVTKKVLTQKAFKSSIIKFL